ncbi:craniofacial development protein 1 isoform X3 [Pteropus alecto]|uniref:craniofacial development protein 1 isoform X3 n=1 Tax=Pteropus alecto TaxID=9402 RepID=UPI000D5373F0|nr:craniofacial development protein 1 isoform X3 [Pteropus alecto]
MLTFTWHSQDSEAAHPGPPCGPGPGAKYKQGLIVPHWLPASHQVNLGGEYSEDDVNELVKEDEVDGEEQTQKTKGKKRKAQSIPARKRKQGGLKVEEEEEEDASRESGGSSSEEEDMAAEQEKGTGSEDARKKKEDELWASFLNDVGPKSKVPPSPQVKKREETKETSSSKSLGKAEEPEKPKETEKVKITKVFDFAGEEVRVTKEVDATSKEAKSFFKQNEKEKPQANVPSALSSLPAGSGTASGPESSVEEDIEGIWRSQLMKYL